jgi:hypothetical protein
MTLREEEVIQFQKVLGKRWWLAEPRCKLLFG